MRFLIALMSLSWLGLMFFSMAGASSLTEVFTRLTAGVAVLFVTGIFLQSVIASMFPANPEPLSYPIPGSEA